MSSRATVMIGILTTVFFVVFGASLVASQQTTFGGLLLVMAVFRAIGVVRQWRALRALDDDEE